MTPLSFGARLTRLVGPMSSAFLIGEEAARMPAIMPAGIGGQSGTMSLSVPLLQPPFARPRRSTRGDPLGVRA